MTLAVGTTLQHGTYVVDAWAGADTIGPVYLAMHVPTGQWVQLRILGSRHLGQLPDGGDRQRFYQYLEQVKQLENSAFPARLGGFEEEGVCYQILMAPAGVPLDRWVTPNTPLPPQRSLGIVHSLIDSLEALRPWGWAGLRLTPDQVWGVDRESGESGVGFTGFDLAVPAAGESSEQESAVVKGLGQLLYFLLTGQRAEATQAPLAVEVRRQHPTLPSNLDRALAVVQISDQELVAVSLTDWRALLPAIADLPLDLPPIGLSLGRPTRVVAGAGIIAVAASRPEARSGPLRAIAKPRSTSAVALGLTGLVATVAGLGVGLHVRLQPASSAAGQERLNPNQAFPPQPNWSGDTLWQPWEDGPPLRNRPYYGTTPPPNSAPASDHSPDPAEPAAPPPAVTQPKIATPAPLPPGDDRPEPVSPQAEPAPSEPAVSPPLSDPAVAPAPIAPPPPLEAPPLSRPIEVAPTPLNFPAPAPAPSAG